MLDEDAAEPIVRAAADGGVTFFDTADVYSAGASEVATGRLLGKMFRRDDVVVATKVFSPMGPGENSRGLSRKHILSGIDASWSGWTWTTWTSTRSTAGTTRRRSSTPCSATSDRLNAETDPEGDPFCLVTGD